MKTAKLNKFGDVICPCCGCNIIVPEEMELRTGIGKCDNCDNKFKVVVEKEDDTVSDCWPTIDN